MSFKGLTSAELALKRNLAAGVFAVFAGCAGIAQAANGPVWLRVSFAVIALVGAVIALVLLFNERSVYRRESEEEQFDVERAERAVGLSLMREKEETTLVAMNNGDHIVRDVEIWAIPLDEDWHPETHGPLPRVHGDSRSGVKLEPVVGGWFSAEIGQLNPGNGVPLLKYEDVDADYQRVGIDLRWNDHEGRQRKAVATADLRGYDLAFSELDVKPRTGG